MTGDDPARACPCCAAADDVAAADTARAPVDVAEHVVVVGFPCWSRRSAGPSVGRLGRRDLLARLGGLARRFRIAGAAAESPEETPTAESIAAVVRRPSSLHRSRVMMAVLVAHAAPVGAGCDVGAPYSGRDADGDAC